MIVGIIYKFSFACFQVKFHQSPSVKILSILWLGSAIILIPYSKGFSFQSSREPTNVSQSERSYVFYWTDGGFNQGCSGILLRTKALSTPLEEFENRGIILKTHHMFSVHATPDEFKNKTITGHFGFFCLKLGMGNPTIPWRHRFRNAPSSNCFLTRLIHNAGVWKFLQRFTESSKTSVFVTD